MKQNRRKEPGFFVALLVTIVVLLVLPLPFALYSSGTEWLLYGIRAVPAEFVVTYLLGLAVLVGGLALVKIRECRGDKNRSHQQENED